MPANLTATNLIVGAPILGAPTAGFYSKLIASHLISPSAVLGRPTLASFCLWTVPANWERNVLEEVAYRTEVLTSRDGTEQRIAQRVNPRYSFSFDVRAGGSRAAELERLLAKRHAYNFRFAHPRASALSDRGHPGAAGFTGRFDGEIQVTARTDRVLDAQLRIAVNPGVYAGDYLTDHTHPPADTFHEGLEVFTLKPNWAEPVRLNFAQFTEILDRQRGVTGFNAPRRFTDRIVQFGLMIRNEGQENRIRGVFERCRGQQGEFYMVDPLSAQFASVSSVSAGATFFTVAGRAVADRFASEGIYRNIAIRTTSGIIYRRVTSISLVSGNSRVNVASALPALAASEIIGIHWLLKVRFAADTLAFSWETDTVARMTINVRALEDF